MLRSEKRSSLPCPLDFEKPSVFGQAERRRQRTTARFRKAHQRPPDGGKAQAVPACLLGSVCTFGDDRLAAVWRKPDGSLAGFGLRLRWRLPYGNDLRAPPCTRKEYRPLIRTGKNRRRIQATAYILDSGTTPEQDTDFYPEGLSYDRF